MKTFVVFENEAGGRKACKKGWSWTVFFFGLMSTVVVVGDALRFANGGPNSGLILLCQVLLFPIAWFMQFGPLIVIESRLAPGTIVWALLVVVSYFVLLFLQNHWRIRLLSDRTRRITEVPASSEGAAILLAGEDGRSQSDPPMNEAPSSRRDKGSVTFRGKETHGDRTYEDYDAESAEVARQFLQERSVIEDLYYVTVFTPEGNWYLDRMGLSLEALLPYQLDLSSAECMGSTSGTPDPRMIGAASAGLADNFVCGVSCGNCEHVWQDGLRYQSETVVRCPVCSKLNRVDSSNFHGEFLSGR